VRLPSPPRFTVCQTRGAGPVRPGATFRCTGNRYSDETCGHLHFTRNRAIRCHRRRAPWPLPHGVAKVAVVGCNALGEPVVRISSNCWTRRTARTRPRPAESPAPAGLFLGRVDSARGGRVVSEPHSTQP